MQREQREGTTNWFTAEVLAKSDAAPMRDLFARFGTGEVTGEFVKDQVCLGVSSSAEEAEYSADLAFAIAIAPSWWAVRTDRSFVNAGALLSLAWLSSSSRCM